MASSRNKNSTGDYQSELAEHNRFINHSQYKGFVANDTICYPGNGLLGCKNHTLVSLNNYIDIETDLFGIGSTNLVNPKNKLEIKLHPFKILDIQHRDKVIMPEPLIVYKNNRPNLH